MRLLAYDGHDNLYATRDLAEDTIPPYAILSHTWGADKEEITLRDLRRKTYKTKLGYRKLELCGQQARYDGLRHFWVDTCCIDKANHVELSKAITCMYRWYQRAQVCYVYLADVSYDLDEYEVTVQGQKVHSSWQSSFRQSRWFTRGWTLQELLAPMKVLFYSREWHLLGTKQELQVLLHDITGIPVTALSGQHPSQFSVTERMQWARGRVTREKEDEAYCLLGLFGVFMPLIYGEGDNAFRRLRKEIMDQSQSNHNENAHTDYVHELARLQVLPAHRNCISLTQRNESAIRADQIGATPNTIRRDSTTGERYRNVLGGVDVVGSTQAAIIYSRDHQHIHSLLWLKTISEPTLCADPRLVSSASSMPAQVDQLVDKQALDSALRLPLELSASLTEPCRSYLCDIKDAFCNSDCFLITTINLGSIKYIFDAMTITNLFLSGPFFSVRSYDEAAQKSQELRICEEKQHAAKWIGPYIALCARQEEMTVDWFQAARTAAKGVFHDMLRNHNKYVFPFYYLLWVILATNCQIGLMLEFLMDCNEIICQSNDNILGIYGAQFWFLFALLTEDKSTLELHRTKFVDSTNKIGLIWGRSHPNYLVSNLAWAWLMLEDGHYREALAELCGCLPTMEYVMGSQHVATLSCLSIYARALAEIGDKWASIAVLKDVLHRTDGCSNLLQVYRYRQLLRLAVLQTEIGDYASAESNFIAIIQFRRGRFGLDTSCTRSVFSRYSDLLRTQQRSEEADHLFKQNERRS